MFRNLRIRNFKCWKDTGDIRMAPITLFFGENSSGKSSIGQLLMMLKQTMESSDRNVVLDPGGRHSAVDLGSYSDMVFERDIKNDIGFGYEWDCDIKKFSDSDNDEINSSVKNINFSADIGYNIVSANSYGLRRFKYICKYNNDELIKIDNNFDFEKERYKFNVKSMIESNNVTSEYTSYHQNLLKFYSISLNNINTIPFDIDLGKIFGLNEKLFNSIYYTAPLRVKTERLYSYTGSHPDSVGYSGERSIAAIISARYRKIGLNDSEKEWIFEEAIAHYLKEMGLIRNFKVREIGANRKVFEVRVQTGPTDNWVDLPDVGFGVSQVLPVLVQAFYAPKNSILIMEQPEIHLHPKAQSALADVMIDVIKSRENGKDRNIQLIIETHSEHFLRRLQRRIAEEKIDKNDVSAYFARVDQHPAVLEELEIDEFGNIINWPEHFFGDEMEDMLKQTEATIRKKRINCRTESPPEKF